MASIPVTSYRTLSNVEHIYKLGDSEAGGTDSTLMRGEWYLSSGEEGPRLECGNLEMVPACKNIFLEVLLNACDAVGVSRGTTQPSSFISIEVSADGMISITNDGIPITIARTADDAHWIPAMVMGQLRSSTNYDKPADQLTAGKNGYGVKLTNIFSTKFMIDVFDRPNRLRYQQTWLNNMKIEEEPVITQNCEVFSRSYVRV